MDRIYAWEHVVREGNAGLVGLVGAVRVIGGIKRCPGVDRADVIEIPAPLSGGGDGLADVYAGHDFTAPFLGPEEEGFRFALVVHVGNIDRPADGVAPVMFFVGRARHAGAVVLPGIGVERIVAAVVKGAAMKRTGAGLGLDLDGAGAVLAVLRAVVGGKNFEFGDGFEIWIDVDAVVGTVVHVVAAIDFPVVVLATAAVDAVHGVAGDADGAFVLSGLADDAGSEGDELREVAAVEFEFLNLLGGDGAAELGGLRVYLGDIFAGDDYFLGNGADGKADIHACFLRDIQHNAFSLKFLKAGCDDGDAISAWGEAEATYTPSPLVSVVRVRFPPALVMTTLAPTTVAPDLSVTVPLMRPLVWAAARAGKSRRASKARPGRSDARTNCFGVKRCLFTVRPPRNWCYEKMEKRRRRSTRVAQTGAKKSANDHSSKVPRSPTGPRSTQKQAIKSD